MFERETRRVKLLEARIREIKLKISQDEAKHKKPIQEEEEEMEEEETEDQEKPEVIPPEPVKELSEIISEIEEGEEEEDDMELLAARNKFFELITDEEEKRKDKKYTLLTRTAFDPNFLPSEFEDTKYKTSVLPKLEDNEAKRIEELKAMIVERKAARKTIGEDKRFSQSEDETKKLESRDHDVEKQEVQEVTETQQEEVVEAEDKGNEDLQSPVKEE